MKICHLYLLLLSFCNVQFFCAGQYLIVYLIWRSLEPVCSAVPPSPALFVDLWLVCFYIFLEHPPLYCQGPAQTLFAWFQCSLAVGDRQRPAHLFPPLCSHVLMCHLFLIFEVTALVQNCSGHLRTILSVYKENWTETELAMLGLLP